MSGDRMDDTIDPRRAFESMWSDLSGIGRDASTGGYRRFAWTGEDRSLREWFEQEASRRGLSVEVDRNGNQWAWWGEPGRDAVVTGSHLDSVPGGGAFDGPLGVVASFLAIDRLREQGVAPERPLAVLNFMEEEGGRFGLACLGSRLLSGATTAEHALGLKDDDGNTLADVIGVDRSRIGADLQALARIGVFVELHVEQGRWLDRDEEPIGVATAIWPHGRWRFCFEGEGNHAGTTRLEDRRDPMLPFVEVVAATRRLAEENGIVATLGRVRVDPNGTNAIPMRVDAWVDARGPEQELVERAIRGLETRAHDASAPHGVTAGLTQESWTGPVAFDERLRARILLALGDAGIDAPVLPTAAGHDAGILASKVPTAMLFVRNPTGISHSPEEHAQESDCVAGVDALAVVLRDLLEGPAFASREESG